MLKKQIYSALMLAILWLAVAQVEANAHTVQTMKRGDGVVLSQVQPGLVQRIDGIQGLSGTSNSVKPQNLVLSQGYGRRNRGYRPNPYRANRPGRYRDPHIRRPPRRIRRPNRYFDRVIPPRFNPYRARTPERYRAPQPPARAYRGPRPAPLPRATTISPSHAINVARTRVNGKLLDIRRTRRFGVQVYVVKFRAGSRVREIVVDMTTGRVLN